MGADVVLCSVPVYHMGIPARVNVVRAVAQGVHAFAGQEHSISQLIDHALVEMALVIRADAVACRQALAPDPLWAPLFAAGVGA